ncbi:MAG: hypothetical protein ABI488_19800 [Polyangiaceae bacterium]
MALLATHATPDQYTRASVAKQVMAEIKELHERAPRYTFNEKSQQSVLDENEVVVVDLRANYFAPVEGQRAMVQFDHEAVRVEEFVRRHFANDGYECLVLESRPLHALFGTLLWPTIQDPE